MKLFALFLLILIVNLINAGCPYLDSLKKNHKQRNIKFNNNQLNRMSPHAVSFEDNAQFSDDPFTLANEQFLEHYKAAKEASITVKLNYPIILSTGNELRLLLNGTLSGTVITENMIPDLYTKLKVIAHTPLNVYAILFPYVYGIDDPNRRVNFKEDTIDLLQKTRTIYQNLLPSVYNTNWVSAVQKDRQVTMLNAVISFLSDLITIKDISYEQLVSFTKSLEDDIVKNINAAGKYQIEEIHGIVQSWKRRYILSSWDNLRVLVSGTHFASNENLVSQYFKWQLPNPNHVVISGEPMNDEELFYILSVTLVDTDVGSTFFQDDSFMHADVLRNSARAWIDYQKIFGGIPDG
mmetsp:Transcript_8584/g.12656  ORF Transcript_8584/g.12656 Transcript_8584/m.12656 type:complete len:351 (+) Transcript_8584:72-1124(+)